MPVAIQNTVKVTKATKAAPATVITQAELVEAKTALDKLAELEKPYKDACKAVDKITLAILQKATGLKKADDWKPLTPQQLQDLMNSRFDTLKVVATEEGELDFGPVCTNAGRYPSWKSEFIKVQGENMALAVQEATPTSHSYGIRIIET